MDVTGAAEEFVFKVVMLDIIAPMGHILFAGVDFAFPQRCAIANHTHKAVDLAGGVAEQQFGTKGATPSDGWPWIGLLALFALVFGVGGTLAFGSLIDE